MSTPSAGNNLAGKHKATLILRLVLDQRGRLMHGELMDMVDTYTTGKATQLVAPAAPSERMPMRDSQNTTNGSKEVAANRSQPDTPPKGGDAIRGLGEKFAADPVTGTGSMSVPIVTSPSHASFGPQFSLSYDSGTGNGSFGIGLGAAR